jgi:hypothetical protein
LTGYSITGFATDRTLTDTGYSTGELANVLATLVRDLVANGSGGGGGGGGGGTGTASHLPTTSTATNLTGNADNYNPGTQTYAIFLTSTPATLDITGLTFTTPQVDGETHILTNTGTNQIVIKNDSANSLAANRFYNSTGGDIVLASSTTAKQAVEVRYVAALSRWLVYLK